MNVNVNRSAGVFHTTSVERAKAAHTTVAHVARKRTFEEYDSRERNPEDLLPTHLLSRVEFRRPVVQHDSCLIPLTAGKIYDVSNREPSEYSQRRNLASTPTPTLNPALDLSHPAYGLPRQLVKNFASLGIKSIYPWQSECLLRSRALTGEKNLVYTAPTGGGKSLVADVLMLKKVLENPGKKALLILPYVALVQEKQRWLRKVVEGIVKTSASSEERQTAWRKRGDEGSIRVVGFYGGSKMKASWDDMDIAVCTIEKVSISLITMTSHTWTQLTIEQANSLVNAAIEDLTIGKLGCVVMDELHMIDDENRGYILELTATKLLSLDLEDKVQLIGMSATLNVRTRSQLVISSVVLTILECRCLSEMA